MKTSTVGALLVLSVLATSVPAGAQSAQVQVPSPLSLEVRPGFDMPLGDSSQWFSYGGAVDLGARYNLPGSLLYLLGGVEYSYAPLSGTTRPCPSGSLPRWPAGVAALSAAGQPTRRGLAGPGA